MSDTPSTHTTRLASRRHRRTAVVGAATGISLATLLLAGCGKSQSPASTADAGLSVGTTIAMEARVESVLASLTLEQKVSQMIQGEIAHVSPDDVREYGLGSVLNGGGSFPQGNKHATVDEWLALADAYWSASLDTSGGGAGVPIIWGTDAVHGHNNVIGATLFPHNIGLGATADPTLVANIAAATAREVRATGIDWIFSPTIAVATDYRWGRTYESFSSDQGLVAEYSGPFVEAMQAVGVAATAKHFVGDGGTFRGDDQGDTRLTLEALMAQHGAGYPEAIDVGVLSVMASFNSWNGDKVHGNHTLLTEVLKESLGFDGFVVSDWNGVGQVSNCRPDDCAKAINAGIDMVMVPKHWKMMRQNLISQAKSGAIPMTRIDDAVRRILRVKAKLGLFDRAKPSTVAAEYADSIGSDAHRALARDAVRRSLVMLKNEEKLLPLNPAGNYLITGTAADNIGQQSGGWTITWQGTGNRNEDFPRGTSIQAGLAAQIEAAGGQLFTEETLPNGQDLDGVIVVYGETPYAEGVGDVDALYWRFGNKGEVATLEKWHEAGVPVVSIFVTGRPLWMNAAINASDAFVVAWLPGSEGGGVADVMLRAADGSVQYDFVGRLPMAWPGADVNGEQDDLPVTDFAFARGYGLSVDSDVQVASLSEDALWQPFDEAMPIFSLGLQEPWVGFIGDAMQWDVVLGARGGASKTGALEVTVADHKVQEDARRLEWSNSANEFAQFFYQAAEAVDMSGLEQGHGALVFDMKVVNPPEGPVALRMDCGWPCSGQLEVSGVLHGMAVEEWLRVAVPLTCFKEAGADMHIIDTPFLLATEHPMVVEVGEVILTSDTAGTVQVPCADQVADL